MGDAVVRLNGSAVSMHQDEMKTAFQHSGPSSKLDGGPLLQLYIKDNKEFQSDLRTSLNYTRVYSTMWESTDYYSLSCVSVIVCRDIRCRDQYRFQSVCTDTTTKSTHSSATGISHTTCYDRQPIKIEHSCSAMISQS